MGILLLLYATGFAATLNYEALKEYKQSTNRQNNIKNAPALQKRDSLFVIDFKDINKMNTYLLEEKYALKLQQCIADGICIFKFLKYQTQPLERRRIKELESNIEDIKPYRAYKFKAF